MAALGHTSTPSCFVIRQLLGFFPGQVHLSEVSFDDIYPVPPADEQQNKHWPCTPVSGAHLYQVPTNGEVIILQQVTTSLFRVHFVAGKLS